jgi:hypothetical protein
MSATEQIPGETSTLRLTIFAAIRRVGHKSQMASGACLSSARGDLPECRGPAAR